MKILLLGANGQVGWELQRALAPLGELIACDFDTPAPHTADFSRPGSLAVLVHAVQPQLIVNAAAHTAVDKAESEPALARALNATAPGILAEQARALGALLVHYSTDYVFDGSGSAPRDETAEPNPLSVYGTTKLEGEQAIQASGCRHLILRTSWVHAARGGNFVRTMLRLAQERDELKVIDDQIGAPTGADLLADITAHAVRAIVRDPDLCGLYHCTAQGETSWHGYARLVVEHARAQGQPVRVAPEAVRPLTTAEYPTPAKRPLNSRLDCTRLAQAFGLQLPPWEQGVRRLLTEILNR
jgi:dTDP-4-dehydrorhamnose reductase